MACPTINCHHRSPICTFIAFQGATPSPLQRCARGHPEVLWSMVAPQLPQLSGQLTALRPSSSISRRLLELEVRRYKHVQTCTNMYKQYDLLWRTPSLKTFESTASGSGEQVQLLQFKCNVSHMTCWSPKIRPQAPTIKVLGCKEMLAKLGSLLGIWPVKDFHLTGLGSWCKKNTYKCYSIFILCLCITINPKGGNCKQ